MDINPPERKNMKNMLPAIDRFVMMRGGTMAVVGSIISMIIKMMKRMANVVRRPMMRGNDQA